MQRVAAVVAAAVLLHRPMEMAAWWTLRTRAHSEMLTRVKERERVSRRETRAAGTILGRAESLTQELSMRERRRRLLRRWEGRLARPPSSMVRGGMWLRGLWVLALVVGAAVAAVAVVVAVVLQRVALTSLRRRDSAEFYEWRIVRRLRHRRLHPRCGISVRAAMVALKLMGAIVI